MTLICLYKRGRGTRLLCITPLCIAFWSADETGPGAKRAWLYGGTRWLVLRVLFFPLFETGGTALLCTSAAVMIADFDTLHTLRRSPADSLSPDDVLNSPPAPPPWPRSLASSWPCFLSLGLQAHFSLSPSLESQPAWDSAAKRRLPVPALHRESLFSPFQHGIESACLSCCCAVLTLCSSCTLSPQVHCRRQLLSRRDHLCTFLVTILGPCFMLVHWCIDCRGCICPCSALVLSLRILPRTRFRLRLRRAQECAEANPTKAASAMSCESACLINQSITVAVPRGMARKSS